jgi:predicted nucleotidyltransferase
MRAAGAEHVSIFGSVARGEATAESDLDILVEFSEPVIQSGFGYFSAMAGLQERIAEITGASHVDIIAEPVRKERLRRVIDGIAPLPTKRPFTRLHDIVENGAAILEYTQGMDFRAYIEKPVGA